MNVHSHKGVKSKRLPFANTAPRAAKQPESVTGQTRTVRGNPVGLGYLQFGFGPGGIDAQIDEYLGGRSRRSRC